MDKNQLKSYIEFVLRGLVNNPDSLSVDIVEAPRTYVVSVSMPEEDIGQLVGRHGKMRSALKTVFWGASRGKSIAFEYNSTEDM